MPEAFYQLFRSDLRGAINGEQRNSYVTFNEGNYLHESRNPVGILAQFSEHYLSGTKRLEVFSETDFLLILPIEGELYVRADSASRSVCPLELFIAAPGEQVHLTNDFPNETTRFYTFQLKNTGLENGLHSYQLEKRNELMAFCESSVCSLSIGVFDGRQDRTFSSPNSNTFVTIVNGAFEVQNRLMETNDSLLAVHDPNLEFEALSENAVILFFSF